VSDKALAVGKTGPKTATKALLLTLAKDSNFRHFSLNATNLTENPAGLSCGIASPNVVAFSEKCQEKAIV